MLHKNFRKLTWNKSKCSIVDFEILVRNGAEKLASLYPPGEVRETFTKSKILENVQKKQDVYQVLDVSEHTNIAKTEGSVDWLVSSLAQRFATEAPEGEQQCETYSVQFADDQQHGGGKQKRKPQQPQSVEALQAELEEQKKHRNKLQNQLKQEKKKNAGSNAGGWIPNAGVGDPMQVDGYWGQEHVSKHCKRCYAKAPETFHV